ncbi:hypothetical protein BJX64DRAFT_271222 [Aspergillus heterothallicus]
MHLSPMKVMVLAIWLAFALMATALPKVSDDRDLALPNHASRALDNFVWRDAEDIEIDDALEDDYDDLEEDYDIEMEYSEPASFSNTSPTSTLIKAVRALAKRHTVSCNVGPITDIKRVLTGVEKLRKKKGSPHAMAKQCVRTWCKKGTSIGWCNDSDGERSLPSYNNIADGIQVILNECKASEATMIEGGISGELDHPDKWRAIVHHTWGCKHR